MRTKLLRALWFLLLLVAINAAPALAQQVSATAVNVKLTASGDLIDATFNVAVRNASGSTVQNLWVIFEDGQQVQVGDVDAGANATSDAVSRTLSGAASANHPIPVTLRYSQDGEQREERINLVVRIR